MPARPLPFVALLAILASPAIAGAQRSASFIPGIALSTEQRIAIDSLTAEIHLHVRDRVRVDGPLDDSTRASLRAVHVEAVRARLTDAQREAFDRVYTREQSYFESRRSTTGGAR